MAEPFFIPSPLLASHGIQGVFSLRYGGVSQPPFDSLNLGHNVGDKPKNVSENLGRLCHAAGLPLPHQAERVHGCNLLLCEGHGRLHDAAADILVSREPGCAVAVRTADCLPLLLAAPEQGIIAAVHAGWRGTVKQAARTAVMAMVAKGAAPDAIIASIGPCIGPCCFETGPEVADALAASQPDIQIRSDADGRCYPDLALINRLQLLQAGVAESNIEQVGECTHCHPHRYFSHRRDRGCTGRHLAVVALPSAT